MLVYVIVCPIITDMMQKYQSKKAACVYKARLRLFKFLDNFILSLIHKRRKFKSGKFKEVMQNSSPVIGHF
jgi:hypothetical protein